MSYVLLNPCKQLTFDTIFVGVLMSGTIMYRKDYSVAPVRSLFRETNLLKHLLAGGKFLKYVFC